MINLLNERVKKLDIWDIGLLKLSVILAAIVIVKLFPQLLLVRYSVLLVLIILLAIRPVCSFLLKK
jgi:hypothetical protein